MTRGETEDAGGLSPAKDDNEAMRHFIRRTLPILDCVGYTPGVNLPNLPLLFFLSFGIIQKKKLYGRMENNG